MDTLTTLTQYFLKANVEQEIRPPPNCPRYPLKEIVNTRKGRVPASLTSTFNTYVKPYVNIKAFERGIIEQYVESDDGVPVNNENLVMVLDGARCGLVGRGIDGISGSTLKKISLKEKFSYIPMSYLQYFLQSNYRLLNRRSRGSVIQHVDPYLFGQLEIPIPDKGDQRFERTTQLLRTIDAIEAQTSQRLQIIHKLKHSFLYQAFAPEK
ncbi:restriction endonuclease subunit S [Lewinella sp. LCG006]|uniref:restriction endonuclease subunit S n=1 Tax=Lewinella sp. LCG006 TaxID=3231911 RepID=UPI00346155E3